MRQPAAGLVMALVVLAAGIATAQQPQSAKPLQFEVASIKPGNPQAVGSSSSTRGGLFQMANTPLRQWVEMGLSVREYALKSPTWLSTSTFSLNARVPDGVVVDQKIIAEMMKSLLVERFGLKWHEELQSVAGYELVADKKVLLQPATLLERLTGAHGSASGGGLIQGTSMPMSEFAGLLGDALGRPVVDATHLSGGFDIKLRWRPSDTAPTDEERRYGKQYGIDVDNLSSSLTTALREQLGLQLQGAKVFSKVVVVDSMNRQPTAN